MVNAKAKPQVSECRERCTVLWGGGVWIHVHTFSDDVQNLFPFLIIVSPHLKFQLLKPESVGQKFFKITALMFILGNHLNHTEL